MKTRPKHNPPSALLTLLPVLLTACTTALPPSMPVQPPQTPPLPTTLSKPAPPANYSQRAQTDIQAWLQTLTASPSK